MHSTQVDSNLALKYWTRMGWVDSHKHTSLLNSIFIICIVESVIIQAQGAIFTTFQFLCNLQMGPISKSFWPWQDIPVYCNPTLKLIKSIWKLQRKWSVVITVQEPNSQLRSLPCSWREWESVSLFLFNI
jgi:hypothetical protein